jgi:hypothetical protein
MPRLIGKQSNNGWYAGLFVIFVIAAAVSIEHFGFINIIPGFGRDYRPNYQSKLQLRH